MSAAPACRASSWGSFDFTAAAEAASTQCAGQKIILHGPWHLPITGRGPGWLTALPPDTRRKHGRAALQSNADLRAGLSRCRSGWGQASKRLAPLRRLHWQAQRAIPSAAVASVPAPPGVEEGGSGIEDDGEGDAPSIELEVEGSVAGIHEEALRLLEWPALCKQVREHEFFSRTVMPTPKYTPSLPV